MGRRKRRNPMERPGRHPDIRESAAETVFFAPLTGHEEPGGEDGRIVRGMRKSRANIPRAIEALQAFCDAEGLEFRIANWMSHYIMRRPTDPPGVHFAQWWPKTGKLVFRCEWPRGVQCHDAAQVIFETARELHPRREN